MKKLNPGDLVRLNLEYYDKGTCVHYGIGLLLEEYLDEADECMLWQKVYWFNLKSTGVYSLISHTGHTSLSTSAVCFLSGAEEKKKENDKSR